MITIPIWVFGGLILVAVVGLVGSIGLTWAIFGVGKR